jgi:soluble lytic murein transglycosylase-like protein
MGRRTVLFFAVLVASAGSARADIAVLTNGQTFKVTSHRVDESLVYLSLKDGGEIGVPTESLRGLVPDEVIDEVAAAPSGSGDLRELATAAARRHRLDPSLVLAVIAVESAFRPEAVSPKGALGLMQLMPATAASLGVKDAFDPVENLDGGARHLGSLLTLFGGDLQRALAAYNAGSGAVGRYNGVPPYRETRAYVKKVLERYQKTK